ncbi:alpha/beta fold hydrolase [Leucobacter komagatae]|uniref:alpha/beta fold hydrolase n=1 Tax=Leucobacter komagatae TaxID=55969 RepID=UPI0018DB87FE|nr:alpha/beta fold hydrolase [Leucobacter komagatae]
MARGGGTAAAAGTPRRLTVLAAGSATAVFEYGPRTGQVIIAVHGFRGTHAGLEPLAQALASLGYRVLAPDLPGSGASAALGSPHDTAGYAAWLSELVDRCDRAPTLLGHSYGTVIVAAAIAGGATARGTVLLNPILTPPLSGPKWAATALARGYYALARRLPAPLGLALLGSRTIAEISGMFMTSSPDRGMRRVIRLEHRRQASAFASREVVFDTYRASTTSTVAHFAGGLRGPTLLVGAGRDPLSPARAFAPAASGMRDAAVHVFSDYGHLLPYEAPAETADLIAAWDAAITGEPGPGADTQTAPCLPVSGLARGRENRG